MSANLGLSCLPADFVGYSVLVENDLGQDVILRFHGMAIDDHEGQPLGPPANLAYVARAGAGPG